MKKWTWGVLIVLLWSVLSSAGCSSRPTGISGTVSDLNVQVRVVELRKQKSDTSMEIFIEGDTVSEPTVNPDGSFEAQLRPGNYVVKVFSVEEELLEQHKARVKRFKMTHLEIELPKE